MEVRSNKELAYSIPNPSWGDLSIVSQDLVDKIHLFCEEIESRFIITSGTTGAHKADWHAKGMAVDGIPECVIKNPHKLFDCFLAASRMGFGGIGFYPYWRYNGAVVGGLHLDVRPGLFTAYWMGVEDSSRKQSYIDLTYENLKAHGF